MSVWTSANVFVLGISLDTGTLDHGRDKATAVSVLTEFDLMQKFQLYVSF